MKKVIIYGRKKTYFGQSVDFYHKSLIFEEDTFIVFFSNVPGEILLFFLTEETLLSWLAPNKEALPSPYDLPVLILIPQCQLTNQL